MPKNPDLHRLTDRIGTFFREVRWVLPDITIRQISPHLALYIELMANRNKDTYLSGKSLIALLSLPRVDGSSWVQRFFVYSGRIRRLVCRYLDPNLCERGKQIVLDRIAYLTHQFKIGTPV